MLRSKGQKKMSTDREPDLFTSILDLLETLSAPTTDKTKETPMTNPPTVDMKPLATISWEMYSAFKDVGFTENQAFAFTVEFVKHMTPTPTIND